MSDQSLFTVSRLGIEVNLPVGATYDILLVNTPAFPVGAITFSFSKPSSSKITGIQKCAQYYLKTLFTTRGSDLINPTFGTDLPNLLVGANANLNSQELLSSITTAINSATAQCKILLNDNTNDIASKLSSVIITGITSPSVDSLSIGLKLTTMAGETGSISLPAPLLATPTYNG